MPQIHGFRDLDTALRLKRIAGEPRLQPEQSPADDCVAWLVLTPADGIEAFDGYDDPAEDAEVPSAMCKAWYLYRDEAGTVRIRKAYGDDGQQIEVLVVNLLPEEIAGNKLARATRCVGGELLIDWMPCTDG